jgi:hypothetical protein
MSFRNRRYQVSAVAVLVSVMATSACAPSILRPSCVNERAPVLTITGLAMSQETLSYTVVSPKSSNLMIRLTWDQLETTLSLSATIINCGGHTGCAMGTITPPFGPGGPSPTPLPWPPGVREMEVDGWKDKTYRIEISSDPVRDTSFTLSVVYNISCAT